VAPLILLMGLPGAGKTTVAGRLASEHSGLRLTPDEWMIPLFGDSDANGKRDVLEGRMITVALQLPLLETNVVLDFGCWSRDERSCLRWLTENEGASFRLIYLPVERDRQPGAGHGSVGERV
jgi:predicted kinase